MSVNKEEFGRLVPSDVVATTKLPVGPDVAAAWQAFKTTQTDEYYLAVSMARVPTSVEGVLFDMFLRGWISAGGKIG